MTLSHTPIYNLGAVLKETGLAADTLRAWERRYGVPMPRRTPGGHRLYSDHDIRLIKWLQGRQAEGMSISRAVQRWNDLLASGRDPLEEQPGTAASPATPTDRLQALKDRWLAACMDFDEATADQILNQAYAQYSVETATAGVIEAALRDIGEMWQSGRTSIQQEHFLSSLATRRLDALIAAAPHPTQAAVVLLACAEDEMHSLPMLYLNLLLRRRGFRVALLGANVPTTQIAETAQSMDADVVVLSAEQLVTAATLREAAAALARKRVLVGYGGRVFSLQPELQKLITGTYLGDGIADAADRIERMLDQPPPSPRRITASPNRDAVAFREGRAQIEVNVLQHFARNPLPSRLLRIANSHFSPALAAALDLGNVRYLEIDLGWIQRLLTSQGLPLKSLQDYLTAYADAVRKVMGSGATGIAGWMRNYAARIGMPGSEPA